MKLQAPGTNQDQQRENVEMLNKLLFSKSVSTWFDKVRDQMKIMLLQSNYS